MDSGRFPAVDFDHFHRRDLPERFIERSDIVLRARLASLRPVAFCLTDGRAFTYVPDGPTVRVHGRCIPGAQTMNWSARPAAQAAR